MISNFQKLEKQRRRCYDELKERIEREKKIRNISEELELQKNLMVCNSGGGGDTYEWDGEGRLKILIKLRKDIKCGSGFS